MFAGVFAGGNLFLQGVLQGTLQGLLQGIAGPIAGVLQGLLQGVMSKAIVLGGGDKGRRVEEF